MEILFKKFNEIQNVLGIVMRGCDLTTEENRQGFINWITEELCTQGVLPAGTKPEDAWSEIMSTTTPLRFPDQGGRCDLIMVCKEGAPFNIGRFAMVKLALPDTSWIEDWLVNDARFYESH